MKFVNLRPTAFLLQINLYLFADDTNIYLFYKIIHLAHPILLSHGVFACFLSYGIAIWGLIPGLKHPYLTDSIFVIQKKVVRAIIFKKRNGHSNPLFGSSQILKLEQVCQLQILSFVYECRNKLSRQKKLICMLDRKVQPSMGYNPSVTREHVTRTHFSRIETKQQFI